MPEIWSRHQVLRPPALALQSAESLCSSPEGHDSLNTARRWLDRKLPVMVTRPCLDADNHIVTCGFAAPKIEGGGKWRLQLHLEHITPPQPPPALAEIVTAFPHLANTPAPALTQAAQNSQGSLHVVGSYAWELMTGLPYLREGSDLDLLLELPSTDCWTPALRQEIARLMNAPSPVRIDLEIRFAHDAAFAWREYENTNDQFLLKTNTTVRLVSKSTERRVPGTKSKKHLAEITMPKPPATQAAHPAQLARLACQCLREELETYPKPGLVSFVDNGSHPDLNADLFLASIEAIRPGFVRMAEAGAEAAPLTTLQAIGLESEAAMLQATGGRNTHRGAIFTLGLLTAAAALREAQAHPGDQGPSLGELVKHTWGSAIANPQELPPESHGLRVCQRHGLSGARGEAAAGYPTIYHAGLPTLREISPRATANAARVQTLFALMTHCEDTTTLHRGGPEGWHFAQEQSQAFLKAGGVTTLDWESRATEIHQAFVQRNLTAGGAADLLAATLFIFHWENPSPPAS